MKLPPKELWAMRRVRPPGYFWVDGTWILRRPVYPIYLLKRLRDKGES